MGPIWIRCPLWSKQLLQVGGLVVTGLSIKNIAARTPSLYLRDDELKRKGTLKATVLNCFPY